MYMRPKSYKLMTQFLNGSIWTPKQSRPNREREVKFLFRVKEISRSLISKIQDLPLNTY